MEDSDASVQAVKALNRLGVFELLADLSSGLLMMILLGPLAFALRALLHTPHRFDDLSSPFRQFISILTTGGEPHLPFSLVLTLALVLGFLSRGISMMYNLFTPRWVQSCVAWLAHHQVAKWHGLPRHWTHRAIVNSLISQDPFHRVGEPTYAQYRAAMDDHAHELSHYKPYWDYEAFLFARSHHFYGLFMSFSILYLLYGITVHVLIWQSGTPLWPASKETVFWLLLVSASFIVTVCLLEEVLIHGIAFTSLDQFLYGRFIRTHAADLAPETDDAVT